MNSIVIKKALPADFKTVADLGRTTFYESWRFMHSEEDMQMYMAEAFKYNNIKADVESDSNIFLFAELNEKLVGYAKLRTDRLPPNSNEFKPGEAIEMERIYVLKEFQDKKAGKALMDESLKIAKSGNFNWLWLAVNAENHKALDFYKRYGFSVFGTKTFKLGNMIDNDYMMKVKL